MHPCTVHHVACLASCSQE
uniref:Uncharacterized protein n=1 Tax=Arundo donax TaxID=35708 RepID=A0A0A9B7N2_ARUDO